MGFGAQLDRLPVVARARVVDRPRAEESRPVERARPGTEPVTIRLPIPGQMLDNRRHKKIIFPSSRGPPLQPGKRPKHLPQDKRANGGPLWLPGARCRSRTAQPTGSRMVELLHPWPSEPSLPPRSMPVLRHGRHAHPGGFGGGAGRAPPASLVQAPRRPRQRPIRRPVFGSRSPVSIRRRAMRSPIAPFRRPAPEGAGHRAGAPRRQPEHPAAAGSAAAFYVSSSGSRKLWLEHEKPFLFRALWPYGDRRPMPRLHPGRSRVQLLTSAGPSWPCRRISKVRRKPTNPPSKTAEMSTSESAAQSLTDIDAWTDPADDRPASRLQPGPDDDARFIPCIRVRAAIRNPDLRERRGWESVPFVRPPDNLHASRHALVKPLPAGDFEAVLDRTVQFGYPMSIHVYMLNARNTALHLTVTRHACLTSIRMVALHRFQRTDRSEDQTRPYTTPRTSACAPHTFAPISTNSGSSIREPSVVATSSTRAPIGLQLD